jgi:hypothetical protein
MSANAAIYNALRNGPQTEAQLRKASKLDGDEFDNELNTWRSRMWIAEEDGDGKSPKFALTEQGRLDMETRYP